MSAQKTSAHPTDLHIGRRIRLRRTLLGLSQQHLASAVGVTFQQIQKYESGTNRISAARLYDVSRALGVTTVFFVEDMAVAGAQGLGDSQAIASPDPMLRTETLELVRAYWALGSDELRQRALDLIQAM